jgi:hypothetical protein
MQDNNKKTIRYKCLFKVNTMIYNFFYYIQVTQKKRYLQAFFLSKNFL